MHLANGFIQSAYKRGTKVFRQRANNIHKIRTMPCLLDN